MFFNDLIEILSLALDCIPTSRFNAYRPSGMLLYKCPNKTSMNATKHQSKIKLLDAALQIIRERGYTATTVDDVCKSAGITKGSFFHHFKSKEELALEATKYWGETTDQLFANAAYQQINDPRARLLAYIDFRAALTDGDLANITCLLGTMVQETYDSHPAIRDACRVGIESHAATLVPTIEDAKTTYAPDAEWDAYSLALYTQVAIQGAFVLAKAQGKSDVAAQFIAHLRRYIEGLLPVLSIRK